MTPSISSPIPAATTPLAGVLTVATSGGQYTAIETALAAASSGQTVLVYPGTYTVPAAGYTVPAGVTLQGVSRDDVNLSAVANSPAAAVTLGAASVVSDCTITMADGASDVGVLMSGAASVAKGLRIGAATAVNATIGIHVTAANCEIRDVTYFTALAQGLVVGATGTAAAFDLSTGAFGVTGKAGDYFIDVAGVLYLHGAFMRLLAGNGMRANAAIALEAEGCSINAPCLLTGAGWLTLTGCYINDTLTASAAANTLRVSGSFVSAAALGAGTTGQLPPRSGTAEILSGNTSIAVAVADIGGAAYDGKPATATFKESDGVIDVVNCTWDGSGNLTINVSAAVAANRDVSWFIPG